MQYCTGRNAVSLLNDFSLKIGTGEFVIITGPSGSGKTTLLNIIGGLLPPTEGKVFLGTKDYYGLTKSQQCNFRAKNIGYVFQDFHLVDDFSLTNNVMLSMQGNRQSKREKCETANNLLSELGLKERLDWSIKDLSGGERQRVAIARALANNRSIMLCDEPTGSLDEVSSNEIMNTLYSLRTLGKTILVVTHNTQYAKFADRVIDFSTIREQLWTT
jgi:ABC-type lipoprotein export system ATPase subunit